jgi:ABC-type transport system involved in multi-copper enzyme maturation permease subunit
MSAETHLEVYRPFTGKLREHPWRFFPLLTTGLRTALKQRRALLVLYLPAFVVTVIMCFAMWAKFRVEEIIKDVGEGQSFQEQLAQQIVRAQANQITGQLLEVVGMILQFAKGMGAFALLAVTWFASGLFCEDKKAGAHQLYFARPITRFDYFLGKFLTAAFFALCAMLVPLLSVCIAASVCSPDWQFLRQQWDVFFRVIAFSLLWTIVISSLVLMASSLASRKSFAMLGVFGFVMLSLPFAKILNEFVDQRLFALALMADLEVIGQHFFGKVANVEGVTPKEAWMAIGALLAVSWGVIWMRLRRLEVVA